MTWWEVFKLISIRSDSINIDTKTYFHIKSDFIFSIESQFQSNFDPGPSVPKTYLWSTTIVPPSKKPREQRASPYLWSTTIVPLFYKLTPIRKLRQIITIFISSKCYLSQNYQHVYKTPPTRFSFSVTVCCGLVFSVSVFGAG